MTEVLLAIISIGCFIVAMKYGPAAGEQVDVFLALLLGAISVSKILSLWGKEAKEAAEETSLWFLQGPLPVQEQTTYDGGSIWAEWSTPYVAEEQPIKTAEEVALEELQGHHIQQKLRVINRLEKQGLASAEIVAYIEEYNWD